MIPYCHAGPNHGPARNFAHWGWLCEGCWAWCLHFVERLCGIEAAARLRARHMERT